MSDNMFAETFVNIGGKRKYTVLFSIVAHTLIIAAAVIVPVVATDSLIPPMRILILEAFPIEHPLPPAPPLPKGALREQQSVPAPGVPVQPPQGIVPEIAIPWASQLDVAYDPGLVPGGGDFAPPAPTPAAPVAVQTPVPVGGNIKRPMKVKDVAPAYPAVARAARVEGVVIVEAIIGPDGKVQHARVLRPNHSLLDAAALDAVRQWEYTPTLLNGIPTAVVMTVTIDFRLR